jgi:V/A-type H+-transporting ATPase subunit I
MAISGMKLLLLGGMNRNFDNIVQTCIVNREFHPENAFDIMQSAKTLRRMEEDNPYADLLLRVRAAAEEANIKLDFNEFSNEMHTIDSVWRNIDSFTQKLRFARSEMERLRKLSEEDDQLLKQLEHMHGVDIEFHEFFNLKYVKFRFGRIPREIYNNFMAHFEEDDDYYYFPTSVERYYVYGMYLMPSRAVEKVDALFASLRFERIYISNRLHGTADTAESEIKQEAGQSTNLVEALQKELDEFIEAETKSILSYYSYARYMSDSFDLRRYAVCTSERFFLYGWIPDEKLDEFREVLDSVSGVIYDLEPPTEVVGVTPPVKLKNHAVFRPFEPFVNMYGRPSYNEFDPTPLMSALYTLLFGVMFGDVGQGILLSLCGFLMWRFKKMWLGRVLIYAGIAGCAFGFFYGSVFGFEHLLPFGFNVLESSENTNLMLRMAVYIGVAVISLVMIINIVNGIRQRNYEKSLFSQNGLCGLIFYLSVMLLVLPMFGFLDVSIPAKPVAIFGVLLPLVFIVLRHPLGKLISGDPDWKPPGIVDFLLENIFELIEVVLSYISNTISFMRVGIFALSHAGMMMVVFLLAGPDESPIVIIIGNLIVMALEALLVGIQVLRLNFYEMFGRFYEAEGKEYQPFIIDYKL